MSNQIVRNYLKVHRRKSGLSQRELGFLVGYVNEGQVRRHERSRTTPPLLVALAYEIVFQVPVSAIFVGIQSSVAHSVEKSLGEFKTDLERGMEGRRSSRMALQKLQWLTDRTAR
jgi:DNA-binding XRE family transcriptional regulator